jgi:hypothetical protein
MRAKDMLQICKEYQSVLDDAKRKFILELLRKSKGEEPKITGQQHQYLQACYDQAISKKFGLEPMSTDKEWAARRAIKNARRGK